jgi:hypothetical protein
MKKIIVLTGIFGLLIQFPNVQAQSKTERVEEKVKSGGDSGSSSDSDSDSIVGFFFELFFDLLPDLFYIQKYSPQEYHAFYNPYPYFPASYSTNGLRSYESNKLFALQFDLDNSHYLFNQTDQNLALSGKWSFGYWGVDASYRRWAERGAPIAMHQFQVAVERKMRFFPHSEAGVQLGYQGFGLRGVRYNGAVLGFESDYYWFKPISFQFNYAGSLIAAHKSENILPVSTLQTGARYHFQNAALGAYYQRLNFDGVVFNSFNIGLSVYF